MQSLKDLALAVSQTQPMFDRPHPQGLRETANIKH